MSSAVAPAGGVPGGTCSAGWEAGSPPLSWALPSSVMGTLAPRQRSGPSLVVAGLCAVAHSGAHGETRGDETVWCRVQEGSECHHIVIEQWDAMQDNRGCLFVSIPSILDPSLCPSGALRPALLPFPHTAQQRRSGVVVSLTLQNTSDALTLLFAPDVLGHPAHQRADRTPTAACGVCCWLCSADPAMRRCDRCDAALPVAPGVPQRH